MASFIDSNILVYAEANDEPVKQSTALALLRRLKVTDNGIISTQVLQEYANVALRKMQLDANHVRKQLSAHQQFEVVQVTPAIIHGALDLHQTRSLSFYDALIVQTASIAGCDTLYSEDLNAGEVINGVRIVNPFV
ncbi:MAG TPA: PIN domain-containing protein [Burkholderiales bacterium]|nr:PIN domain-containing protein [Burkholderiales bacterium]